MATANPGRSTASPKPSLNERVTKLEQLVDAGMNVRFAAKVVGMSEDEVRTALRIPANAELTDEVFVTALTRRVAKNRSGVEKANERASKLERRADNTDQRLAAIEEFLGRDNLGEALKAGQDGGRKSFIQALRDRKVSDDDIRRVLVIVDGDELDLSDDQLFYELYSAHELLCTRVDTLSTEVSEMRDIVEDLDDADRISLLGWLVAFALAVLVWFTFWINPFGVSGVVHDDAGKNVGTFSGGWNSGWLGFGLAIMTFAIVLLIARGSGRRRRTVSHHETSRSSASSTAFRQRIAHVRSRNRAQDTTPSNEDDTVASQPEPSPASS